MKANRILTSNFKSCSCEYEKLSTGRVIKVRICVFCKTKNPVKTRV